MQQALAGSYAPFETRLRRSSGRGGGWAIPLERFVA
jgi:hypothetical protein